MRAGIQWKMKLVLRIPKFYRVKRGQTLLMIASAFQVSPALLATENAIAGEVEGGEILKLPARGNIYTVQGGESKTLLCGSPQRFFELNGTAAFYPGQKIILP